MTSAFRLNLLRCIPGVVFLVGWECIVRFTPRLQFFFGSPSKVAEYFVEKTLDGSLVVDAATTTLETVLGFAIGNIIGTTIGMALWYSRRAFDISKPYIVGLGSAPIFALAPLLIVWFGTGIFSKIMIAALSTVFIAMFQAYTGAGQTDQRYAALVTSFGASKWTLFRKLVAPAAVVWVINGWRLNVGFALLGAFIGEFISSSQGLGHLILVASGLFDVPLVLCGVFSFIGIALLLNYVITRVEPHIQRAIIRWL